MRTSLGPVARQFLLSFSVGLTAIGIANLWSWLRAPVTAARPTTGAPTARPTAEPTAARA